ncbi:MAG: bifunctional DNA primase/polymerase [Bifidobacterium longum]|nr:bifunctional DNA primase/polymerase [Bifidobacterium longum]
MTDHDVTDGNGILPCFDPLPPARPVPDYAGKIRLHEQLLVKVSCAASELDESWRIIGSDGRRICPPRDGDGKTLCSNGVARLMAELRVTMGGEEPLIAVQEGTGKIWHRVVGNKGRMYWRPIAGVDSEYGIPASEHMGDLDTFTRCCLRTVPKATLILGVRYAHIGIARRYDGLLSQTDLVLDTSPDFGRCWALDLPDVEWDPFRAGRYEREAAKILDGDAAVKMLARIIAAPVAQPYPHGFAVLAGQGGDGKGRTIDAIAAMYGELANPFSLAALLGVARSSSTTNDQATSGLLTGLLAYDSDAVNPGQGLIENLKKASAGESLSMRLLQQNVVSSPVTAFILLATNHTITLPSTPEWRRRIWQVPFRRGNTDEAIRGWSRYLGDGSDPDDGIYDALIAGTMSFAFLEPDPVTTNNLIDGLSEGGRMILDAVMQSGPQDADGMPIDPRVPVNSEDIASVGRRERGEQYAVMGLATRNSRNIYGDKKPCQVITIRDRNKFTPFARLWQEENRECLEEEAAERSVADGLAAQIRQRLYDVTPPPADVPGIPGQVGLLRSVEGFDATLLVAPADAWHGKGLAVKWQDPASRVRQPLATADPARIPGVYGLLPDRHVIIIDIDAAKHGGTDGIDTLAAIPGLTAGDLVTMVMRSPHGLHLVYRMPADWIGRVKAATHVHGAQIDLRTGERSYVVGPGSRIVVDGSVVEYPGVVALPPIVRDEDGDGGCRRLPMLPPALARWIMQDKSVFDVPSSSAAADGKRPYHVPMPADDGHVPIPPMMPGATHDALRDTALRIAGRAAHRGYDRQWLDGEMDRLRAAVPAGHDPRDTDACIASAVDKAYSGR